MSRRLNTVGCFRRKLGGAYRSLTPQKTFRSSPKMLNTSLCSLIFRQPQFISSSPKFLIKNIFIGFLILCLWTRIFKPTRSSHIPFWLVIVHWTSLRWRCILRTHFFDSSLLSSIGIIILRLNVFLSLCWYFVSLFSIKQVGT